MVMAPEGTGVVAGLAVIGVANIARTASRIAMIIFDAIMIESFSLRCSIFLWICQLLPLPVSRAEQVAVAKGSLTFIPDGFQEVDTYLGQSPYNMQRGIPSCRLAYDPHRRFSFMLALSLIGPAGSKANNLALITPHRHSLLSNNQSYRIRGDNEPSRD